MSENNGFKNTEIGIIPVDWEINEIQNISKKIWIGLVTTMTSHYVENGIPLIRNNNIKPNKIFSLNMIFLDVDFSECNKQRYLHTGDIVTVHTGDIGTSTIIEPEFDPSHGFATINTSVDETIIHNKYLCYYFNSPIFKHRIEAYATGDGRSNFNLYDYLFIKVPYPQKIHEQRKIARILSTVDAVIEKTKAAIAKYKNIKTGMIRDLFTRGIDFKTGKLRPSYKEAPELYKHSELGWVPKDWEVLRIGSFSHIKGGKRLPAGREFSDSETPFPYIRVTDMVNGSIYQSDLKYVPVDIEPIIRSYKISKKDVYVTIAGTLGLFGTIPDNLDNAQLTENAAKITDYNPTQYERDFIKHQCNCSVIQKQIIREIGIGGGVPKLALFRIARFLFLKPEIEEQKQIINCINRNEQLILNEERNLVKLLCIKQGLMSDLLTGKVRVKFEEEKEEAL